jgi:hypothetical protein
MLAVKKEKGNWVQKKRKEKKKEKRYRRKGLK